MISVVIIGCGNISLGYDSDFCLEARPDFPKSHLGALLAYSSFDLVACVDPLFSKRSAVKKLFPNAQDVASVEDLTLSLVDVVVVAGPSSCRREAIQFAIRCKAKLIVCEKPMSSCSVQAKDNFEAVRNSESCFVMNLSRLWDPSIRLLKERIAEGEFGDLQSGQGVLVGNFTHNGPHMIGLLLDFFDQVTVGDVIHTKRSNTITLSAGEATVTIQELNADNFAIFELVLFFERAVVHIEDGGRRLRVRHPVVHPQYPNILYPEDEEMLVPRQREMMLGLWENILSYFEANDPFPRTIDWFMNVDAICHVIEEQIANESRVKE